MKNKAIFAGSFNPFHIGHKEVLQQSAKLFDMIYLVITFNPNKKAHHNYEERLNHIKEEIKEFQNVEIIINKDKLTANLAKELNCKFLIRGLRNKKDFDYEIKMSDANSYINNELSTIFFITNKNHRKISSSLLNEINNIDKNIKR